MKRCVLLAMVMASALGLTGCAGIDIHDESADKDGYVVYSPLVIVEVKKEIKDGQEFCAISQPFVLPDYSKPFRIDLKSGFGKAGTELSITNGWLLSSVKDNSDNAKVMEYVSGLTDKAFGFMKREDGGDKGMKGAACKPGLYKVGASGKLELYFNPATGQ